MKFPGARRLIGILLALAVIHAPSAGVATVFEESGGVCEMEAEAATVNQNGDTVNWIQKKDPQSSGGVYMTTLEADKAGNWYDACELSFQVKINMPGAYSIAVHQIGVSGANSAQWGVDGTEISGNAFELENAEWEWVSDLATANLTAGIHTINIRRREAGWILDKIIIAKDPGSLPVLGRGTEEADSGRMALALVYDTAPVWASELDKAFVNAVRYGRGTTVGSLLKQGADVNAAAPDGAKANTAHEGQAVDFRRDVIPILAHKCFKCHARGKDKGGFSMNSRESFLKGSESGAVVVPGNADDSLLLELVLEEDLDDRMPPKGAALTPKEIDIIRKWIDNGLAWDDRPALAASPNLDPKLVKPKLPPGSGHPIDRILSSYFKKHGAGQSIVDDATYAKRAYLDIIGLLPKPEEVQQFSADKRSKRKKHLAMQLLSRDLDYADAWMPFWQDHLRDGTKGQDAEGNPLCKSHYHIRPITKWLHDSLQENKPFDKFAQELINPPGKFYDPYRESGKFNNARQDSTGFVQGIRIGAAEPLPSASMEVQAAQNITQVFLGTKLKCATCHDSFVDHWKQDDIWGIAAVYSDKPLPIYRFDKPIGRDAIAKFLFEGVGEIDADAPRREKQAQLAALMTSPRNGLFARTIVNRLWAKLFGRGLVEPIDDMANDPWHRDLLDFLAADLIEHEFDLKHTLELIITSRAYQLPAVEANTGKQTPFIFRGPMIRRMTAEQYLDNLFALLGSPVRNWKNPYSRLLGMLGRPDRQTVTTQRPIDATALQALELLNGPRLHNIIYNGEIYESSEIRHHPIINMYCPVTGEIIDPDDSIAFKGQHIAFSSKKAMKSFTEDPAKYLDKLEDLNTRIPLQAFNRVCPVTDEVVDAKDSLLYKGNVIGFASRGKAMRAFLKNPERYASKLKIAANINPRKKPQRRVDASDWSRDGKDQKIHDLWLHALGRTPNKAEYDIAMEIINDSADNHATGHANLIWMVAMMPEFQLIY